MSKEFTPDECNKKFQDLMDVMKRTKERAEGIAATILPSPAYAGPYNMAAAYAGTFTKDYFDVIIIGYDESKYIEALKEFRKIFSNIGLAEAKDKLKNQKTIVYSDVSLSTAEYFKKDLEKFGFKVEIK